MPFSRRMPRWKFDKARQMRKHATRAERTLYRALVNRLPIRVRRQTPMAGYIADIYIAKAKLVVEVDGPIHLTRLDKDADRDRNLARLGIRTLRFTNERIESDLGSVVERIAAVVEVRYPRIHSP